MGSRKIKVSKESLIKTLLENKETHIKEYEQAVVAYEKTALKQLKELTKKVKNGDTNIKLNLVSPVNNSERYDKIIEMFDWELDSEVELTQEEFKDYVQNDFDFARSAKLLNSTYL